MPAPGLTHSEAKDAKIQSTADYKARKNIAEANHDLNKADCKVNADGAVERACKADARMQEKKDKADAKLIHKQEDAGHQRRDEVSLAPDDGNAPRP